VCFIMSITVFDIIRSTGTTTRLLASTATPRYGSTVSFRYFVVLLVTLY